MIRRRSNVIRSFIDQTDRLHHAALDPIYDTVGVDDLSDIDRDYGCRHPHDARLTINIEHQGRLLHTYPYFCCARKPRRVHGDYRPLDFVLHPAFLAAASITRRRADPSDGSDGTRQDRPRLHDRDHRRFSWRGAASVSFTFAALSLMNVVSYQRPRTLTHFWDSQIRETLTRCWLLREERHRWERRYRSPGLI